MKTLLSAFLLLAFAAPGAHAQSVGNGWNAMAEQNTTIGLHAIANTHGYAVDNLNSQAQFGSETVLIGANCTAIGNNVIAIANVGREAHPATRPFLDYSADHRLVHVSGVVLEDGQPVPGATVNLIADLDGGFNAFHQVRADTRGVYNDWFQAPARIQSVHVDTSGAPISTDDGEAYNVGAGVQ